METGQKPTRRTFLKNATSATLGFALIPSFLKIPPSDRLRVAHIGLGGMGNAHMNWFVNLPEVDVVALCDVDLALGTKTRKRHPKANQYQDFREMLDVEKNIDAVTVSTPDHTHAVIAMAAMQRV